MNEFIEKTVEKQPQKPRGRPWPKGVSGNPKGRPKGKRNFKTDFELACREVAETLKLGKEPDRVKIEIIKAGIKGALKEKYPFWGDLMDRIYGKVEENLNINYNIFNLIKNAIIRLDRGRNGEIHQIGEGGSSELVRDNDEEEIMAEGEGDNRSSEE